MDRDDANLIGALLDELDLRDAQAPSFDSFSDLSASPLFSLPSPAQAQALPARLRDLRIQAGSKVLVYAICEDQPSCSAKRPPSADNLPSSIHPDYSLQTGNDFLLVTDDDVGFYVDRDFLLCHSELFHDFENMACDISNKDAIGDCIKSSVVRRDMPGALSKGLRVVLLNSADTDSTWPDFHDFDNESDWSPQRQTWPYTLEDLALAIKIANQYGFTSFSSQAHSKAPRKSLWFQYLLAAFESDERGANAIAKSTLYFNLETCCPLALLSILDKHNAPYATLLRDIHDFVLLQRIYRSHR
ncbi:hypothetical protein L198_08296 [Cryptococcus wingfieldii CBS 7118]|uniref:Uncharacterized protein n=1 Tax=Cryptococcus wingfieldii CBS 7118 TaxID=1295528 RepID=A0A1E3HB87_9TREE|nr:hypothetical protein L198_08296 [Cryptococcus wingfieldii CBS 7118]ODN73608.1 hypothetical protein L198_08296 [Cryptococcus wingfieldii CBS 7118]